MAFLRAENLWLYIPLILWISGILYLSSNKGSDSRTMGYFSPVFNLLFPKDDAHANKRRRFYIRKLCHFVAYAILALWASIVFYNSSLPVMAKFWYAGAFVIVLVVASIDEIRQSFYPERTGSLSDVALDCSGGLTMILLFWLCA